MIKDWNGLFEQEKQKSYFMELMARVEQEYRDHEYCPPFPKIFSALALTPLDQVKCVIVGQDPYHTPGQAMGLSFSTPTGRPVQPSLQNIYKEIHDELGVPIPPAGHGDLTAWAKQGVLLLNATLTVRAHAPNSHSDVGWQQFTDEVLKAVNSQDKPVVYLLWGRNARDKAYLITNRGHLVLQSPHPSPYSADKGFFGNGHFRKCNQFLADNGISPINWAIA